MTELLNKLSSYNLFNNLLPGTLFVFLASEITHRDYVQRNVLVALALYYLVGLVISRFGSLVIEPLFLKLSFIRFAEYGQFIEAAKRDEKIEIFSEINNMYRTLCSLFALLSVLILYVKVVVRFPFLSNNAPAILSIVLFITFAFSYRKQTLYITKRTKAAADTRVIKP
jgi:hypothetical protein